MNLNPVMTRDEALTRFGRAGLSKALKRGLLVRPSRGNYCDAATDPALLAAAKVNGVVTLRSAALLHGWKVLDRPKRPEIAVPRHRKISPADHRGIQLRFRDHAADQLIGLVTTPVVTVLDCAVNLPFEESLAIADSALRVGHVTKDELLEAITGLPKRHQAKARRVVTLADPKAANPFESAIRAMALECDPTFEAQLEIELPTKTVHPDVGHRPLRLAFEAESFEFHGHRGALHNDCTRYNQLVLGAWLVLRFTWESVMFARELVREDIRAAIRLQRERAGRTGTRSRRLRLAA